MRLKAMSSSCFNTQPPEGGWLRNIWANPARKCFNTQPPEGGWLVKALGIPFVIEFQHTAA